MPKDIFLDGEIWFGRENFQEALKLAQRVDTSGVSWEHFRYMVFDLPKDEGNFSERYQKLADHFTKNRNPYVQLAPYELCTSTPHLEKYFQDVVDQGGEGIILRDPQSPYQEGRSAGYLKHKRFRDAEARIIKPIGNHQWECELPNGVTFTATAGTYEFVKRCDPKPGDIVSFKHHGFLLATKKPKLATLYRLRTDTTWQDVQNNWKEQKSSVTAWPIRRPQHKNLPKGYWNNHDNVVNFFNKMAADKGFDPNNPDNWLKIGYADVKIAPGGKSLLTFYGGSLKSALMTAFPDLTFHFKATKPKKYWNDTENVKKFLIKYAEDKGFDPQDPKAWSEISLLDFLEYPGTSGLVRAYGNLRSAVAAAFPDVDFKFPAARKHRPFDFWEHIENRKNFFNDFAARKGFDPTVADNWLNVTREEIIEEMGRGPLRLYDNSLALALRQTFPELKLKLPLSSLRRKKIRISSQPSLLQVLS